MSNFTKENFDRIIASNIQQKPQNLTYQTSRPTTNNSKAKARTLTDYHAAAAVVVDVLSLVLIFNRKHTQHPPML